MVSIPIPFANTQKVNCDAYHGVNGTGVAAFAYGLPTATGMHDSHAVSTWMFLQNSETVMPNPLSRLET